MDNCQDRPTILSEALWRALMNLPAFRYMKAPVDNVAQLYEKYLTGNEKGTFAFVHDENTFYTYHPRGWNRGEWLSIAGGMESFFEINTDHLQEGDILVYDSNKKKFVVRSGNVWNKIKTTFTQVTRFLNQVENVPLDTDDTGIYFVHSSVIAGLYLVLAGKSIKIFNSSDWYIKEIVDEKITNVNEHIDSEISRLENNMVNLGIRKIYPTYEAMIADTNNPIADDGTAIRNGELVSVFNPLDTSKNGIYRYNVNQGVKSWTLVSNMVSFPLSNEIIDDPNSAPSSQLFKNTLDELDPRLLQIITAKYLYTTITPDGRILMSFDKNATPFIANLDRALSGIITRGSLSESLIKDNSLLLQTLSNKYLFSLITSDEKKLFTFDQHGNPFIANIDKAIRGQVSIDSMSDELQSSIYPALQMKMLNSKWRFAITSEDQKLFLGVHKTGATYINDKIEYNKPFMPPYSVTIDSNSIETILTQTQTFESRGMFFYNVLKITENLWYMWYSVLEDGATSDFQANLCFAYSTNGKDWIKGIPDQPERENNIIVSGLYEKAWLEHITFIEPSDTEYPYRILYSRYKADADGEQALYMSKSANGWDWIDHKLIINKKFDTQYSIDILPNGNYLIFLRLWDDPIHTDRQVGTVVINPNGNIVEPIKLILTGGLYTSSAHTLGNNRYVLFPTLYNSVTQNISISISYFINGTGNNTFENITSQLLSSEMSKWACVCPKLIPTGVTNEYWMYYYGRNKTHDDTTASITNYYRCKVKINQINN